MAISIRGRTHQAKPGTHLASHLAQPSLRQHDRYWTRFVVFGLLPAICIGLGSCGKRVGNSPVPTVDARYRGGNDGGVSDAAADGATPDSGAGDLGASDGGAGDLGASDGGVPVRQREEDGVMYLENGLVEVGIERASGQIASLRDLESGREWIQDGEKIFPLAVSLAGTDDIWQAVEKTAAGGAGGTNSTPQCSFAYPGGSSRAIRVVVESLHSVTTHEEEAIGATYSIRLDPGSRETRWELAMQNDTDRVVVLVAFPYLGHLNKLTGAELTRPHMAGLRTVVADLYPEHDAVLDHYPARLSMPWYDLSSTEDGIYVASNDLEPSSIWLGFSRNNGVGGWTLSLSRQPFIAANGGQWTAPPSVVMPHPDGWHAAARAYRRFYQANFSPIVVSPRVQRLSAIASVHLKTPWNPSYTPARGFAPVLDFMHSHAYTELGIRDIRLDGWNEQAYGTFVPGHLPLEELGGDNAFKDLITTANGRGLNIYPYVAIDMINENDDMLDGYGADYVAIREQCAVRGPRRRTEPPYDIIDFTQTYVDTYDWPEWFGAQSAVYMCMACDPWRQLFEKRMLHLIEDVGVPGLYVDAFGMFKRTGVRCYDKNHNHDTPAEVWGQTAVSIAKKLHDAGRARDPNFLLFTEANFDRLFPYMDLPFTWSDESRFLPPDGGTHKAPEVIRYTFDNLATQKIYSHGDSDGVALALLTANVIDSGGHILRLVQDRMPDVFYDGYYTDTVGIVSTPASAARVVGLRGAKRFAIGVLAHPGSTGTLSITLDLAAMNVDFVPTRARALALKEEDDKPLSFTQSGGKLQLQGPMPAAGVPGFVLFE